MLSINVVISKKGKAIGCNVRSAKCIIQQSYVSEPDNLLRVTNKEKTKQCSNKK